MPPLARRSTISIPRCFDLLQRPWLGFLIFTLTRFWSRNRAPLFSRPTLAIPLALVALLCSFATVLVLQGPGQGALFLGRRTGDRDLATANPSIAGTTISTAMCFLDPTAPVPPSSYFSWICRSVQPPQRPTLDFEGDSHAHALLLLGRDLLRSGS